MKVITIRFQVEWFVTDDIIKSADGRHIFVVVNNFGKSVEVKRLDGKGIDELPYDNSRFYTIGHMLCGEPRMNSEGTDRRLITVAKVDSRYLFDNWKDLLNERKTSKKTFSEWVNHLKKEKFYTDNENHVFWRWDFNHQIHIKPPEGRIIESPPRL